MTKYRFGIWEGIAGAGVAALLGAVVAVGGPIALRSNADAVEAKVALGVLSAEVGANKGRLGRIEGILTAIQADVNAIFLELGKLYVKK